jgi:hypothetical protein
MSAAAKGATQIDASGVARMGEEPNPAIDAVHRAGLQSRMVGQNSIESRLILPNKRVGLIILVPIWPKREKLLDSDDKKARLSVKIFSDLHTPSSYLLDAKSSRGRTRIFVALGAKMSARNRPNRPTTTDPPNRCRLTQPPRQKNTT